MEKSATTSFTTSAYRRDLIGATEIKSGAIHRPFSPNKKSEEILSLNCQQAYARRRTWSRTDSARWINDRSAPVLAILRRRQGNWPAHSRSLGYWLKEHTPDLFLNAHAILAAAKDDDTRDGLLPQEVIP